MPGSDGSDEVEEIEDGGQESEEDFEDGEGNFFTRRVYRASDGSYFLVLDYAG